MIKYENAGPAFSYESGGSFELICGITLSDSLVKCEKRYPKHFNLHYMFSQLLIHWVVNAQFSEYM